MSLTSTLSNALAGMNASQRGLEVVARNVANAGTPGYHRQSLAVREGFYGGTATVRLAGVERAFEEALQHQYSAAVSAGSYHAVTASFLARLETHLGMPGDAHSLDTLYKGFENGLLALAATPDDAAGRAQVVNAAQAFAGQLNRLAGALEETRREVEGELSQTVDALNRQLQGLAELNLRIAGAPAGDAGRLAMLDQRDRLVASIAEKIDVKASYRADGSVALHTGSGVGLLDGRAARLDLGAGGGLALVTASGQRLDLARGGALGGGSIAALLDLRDGFLPDARAQLDEIAAGLALAMSSVTTEGARAGGAVTLDIAGLVTPGDEAVLSYKAGGQAHGVRLVRVEDPASVPVSPNAAGETVLAFTPASDAPADIAAAMAAALAAARDAGQLPGGGGLDFSVSPEGRLAVQDGGGATVAALSGRATVTATSGGGLGLPLFLDGATPFTGSLDGGGQKQGLAARLRVNPAVLSDNSLLVRYEAGVSLGDPARPQALLDNLRSLRFSAERPTARAQGGTPMAGTLGELIAKTLNHQGNVVAHAKSQAESQSLTLEAVDARMRGTYGVSIDEEMGRLIALQNAYSAGARVISTVQQLMDALLRI